MLPQPDPKPAVMPRLAYDNPPQVSTRSYMDPSRPSGGGAAVGPRVESAVNGDAHSTLFIDYQPMTREQRVGTGGRPSLPVEAVDSVDDPARRDATVVLPLSTPDWPAKSNKRDG